MKQAAVVLCLALAFAVAGCSKKAPAEADEDPVRTRKDPPHVDDIGDPFVEASLAAGPLQAGSADLPSDSASALSGTAGSATMKLLDPGRPPRRKLRYAWRRDQRETVTIDLRTSAATETEGEKPSEVALPPVRIVVAIEPRNISAEGDLHYAWRVTSTAVTLAPAAPAQITDGMRAEVATIAHLAGWADVTSRGLARDVAVDPASVTDAGASGQMVEQVRQTLRDLAAPLPEEEVGRGGRWEKLSQLASRDALVTQTETFSLVDLGASTGGLEDILAQTAPPQPLTMPGAPRGRPARLDSMLASGAAKTRFDLTRLVPASTFDGTTTMVVSGHTPGDSAKRMTMTMRVGIVLSGSKP